MNKYKKGDVILVENFYNEYGEKISIHPMLVIHSNDKEELLEYDDANYLFEHIAIVMTSKEGKHHQRMPQNHKQPSHLKMKHHLYNHTDELNTRKILFTIPEETVDLLLEYYQKNNLVPEMNMNNAKNN